MSFRLRHQKLKESYRPREEWWSRVFATPVGYGILHFIADFKFVTPNLLTVLSLFFVLLTSFIINSSISYSLILAAITLQVAYIFDCMDGQLARYRGVSSNLGAFLDKCLDYIKFPFLLLALAKSVFDKSGDVVIIYVAMITSFFICFLPYLKEMVKNDFSIPAWEVLSKSNFKERNLRFFLFEEAQWYFIVSVCLLVGRVDFALWILCLTQGTMSFIQLSRVFYLLTKKR